MATEKSNVDLQSEINDNVTSEVNQESITPASLGGTLANMQQSAFNKVDGAKVGINGRSIKTAGAIPALYTGLNDGDSLETVIARILAATNATQIAVTGGIQGSDGEFAACITSDTRQIFDAHCTVSFDPIAALQFANDKDNGSFDNGNNWRLERYTASSAITRNFKLSAIELQVANTWGGGSSSGDYVKFKVAICKNGDTGTPLATSDVIEIRNDTAGGALFYIPDFSTGNVTLAINDYVEVFIYKGEKTSTTPPVGSYIKINSALFTNEG